MTIFRDVKPSDSEDLIQNFYEFFDELAENQELGMVLFKEKPSYASELSWFAGLYSGIEKGDIVATVAEVNSHVVGLCEVTRLRPHSDLSHRGGLGIAVKKEFRGKGVGTGLLKQTLEKSKEKFEIIELAVFSTNTGARELYERFGFKIYGHVPGAIKRGGKYIDEDLMYLKL